MDPEVAQRIMSCMSRAVARQHASDYAGAVLVFSEIIQELERSPASARECDHILASIQDAASVWARFANTNGAQGIADSSQALLDRVCALRSKVGNGL